MLAVRALSRRARCWTPSSAFRCKCIQTGQVQPVHQLYRVAQRFIEVFDPNERRLDAISGRSRKQCVHAWQGSRLAAVKPKEAGRKCVGPARGFV
jgi:hypothetical protein